MQTKAKARAIGVFVLGGIVLLVAGIIALSSAELFSRRLHYVMYFDSSLNGLDIGSPVSFRGVNIGRVTNIVMEFDREKREVSTPVFVEIDPARFKIPSLADGVPQVTETPISYMIRRGLRAQLMTRSLITGQQQIELEFRPAFPARFVGRHPEVDEIPTVPSRFDQVQTTVTDMLDILRKLPLDELAYKFMATLENISEVSKKLNEHMEPILANTEQATAEAVPTMKRLRSSLERLDASLKESEQMFRSLNKRVETTAPAMEKSAQSADSAFKEVEAAMRALRNLADYLERNPDALLTGKQDRR